MAIFASDSLSGYVTPATSGAAPFPTADGDFGEIWMAFAGTPTTNDSVAYTLTFPGGTVTIRARWTSSTTLIIERISTIAGTSNGTATLQTFTGTNVQKPRTDGELSRLRITVTRGAVNALTAIGYNWRGRSTSPTTVSGTFNVDGELTATAGAFALVGTSFYNRPNLHGRAADGFGSGPEANGTWEKVFGQGDPGIDPLSELDTWGVESDGECRPQPGTLSDTFYQLVGSTAPDDQISRVSFTFDGARQAVGIIATRLTGDWTSGPSGYVLFLLSQGDGDISADLYRYDAGAFTFLDSAPAVGVADGTPHDFELESSGTTHTVRVDSVDLFFTTDATYASGDPGIGGYRDDRDDAGIEAHGFQGEEAGVVVEPPNPCEDGALSRDALTGTGGLDGRATDSTPGEGQWAEHPEATGTLEANDGVAVMVDGGRAIYRDTAIAGIADDYCVEVVARFPGVDDPGTGTPPFWEVWRYRVRVWTSSLTAYVSESGLVADLVGGTFSYGLGFLDLSGVTVWANGQPKTFTGGVNADSDTVELTEFYAQLYSPSGAHTVEVEATWEVTDDPEIDEVAFSTHGLRLAVNNTAQAQIPLGAQNVWPDHPYPPFYFPLGQPATDTRTLDLSGTSNKLSLIFTSGGGLDVGTVEVSNIAEIELDLVTSIDTGTPGSHAEEHAYVEALVRWDGLVESGYGLRLDFDHPAGIVGTLALAEYTAGVRTVMWSSAVDLEHDLDYTLNLRVQDVDGDPVLVVVFDGSIEQTLEIADTAYAVHSTGDPGLAALDEMVGGDYNLEIETYTVYAPGGSTIPPWWPPELPWPPPCEGEPENPYPELPPVPPVVPVDPVVMWVRRNLAWREVMVPTEDYASEAQVRRNLAVRLPERIAVRKNLAWRYPADPDTDETSPPVDDTFPPHYDPCEQHPEIPPPPTEDLGPPPDRLFFAFDLPVTTIPDPFTTAVTATGPWSPGILDQAEARGGSLVGGIGGYGKYQAGEYVRGLMQAWINSHSGYMSSELLASPNFYGQIAMDDHAAFERWNWPSGWDINDVIDEISWIAGYWKSTYPGVRVGIRAREAQFSGANYPANLDFMMAQYRYWGLGGLTPAQFVDQELDLADTRGHDILFSVNFENGGLGPSSPYGGAPYTHYVQFELGAGELDTAWEAMTVDVSNMHGIGGWKYSAAFLSHPGILDTIAVRRNALEAIGAP